MISLGFGGVAKGLKQSEVRCEPQSSSQQGGMAAGVCWCISVKHKKVFSVCRYCSRELFSVPTHGASSYTGTGGQRQHKFVMITDGVWYL